MKDEILFSEIQRFKQWWIWLFLLGPTVFVAYGVLTQVVLGRPFGDKPSSDAGLLLVLGIAFLITFSFFSFRLETIIREDGIYVRFFPFHVSFKRYPWGQIHRAYIRQYKPIWEYGGWGLRGLGKNRALNVSGNQGLQLELEGNVRLLIGTKHPEEINEVLLKIKRYENL